PLPGPVGRDGTSTFRISDVRSELEAPVLSLRAPRAVLLMGDVHASGDLFNGPGAMRALCREHDWASSPLGPVESWPEALRTTVRTVLDSPFAINLWCGPELVLIYNDAYRHVLGSKHPHALGRSGREVWAEIWPQI